MRLHPPRHLRRGLALAGAALLVATLVPAAAAHGPAPRIAFTRLGDHLPQIVTINPNGTGEQIVPLDEPAEDFAAPIWSGDRSHLLISHQLRFDANDELLPFRPAIVRPNGTDYRLVDLQGAPFDADCRAWSQDERRLYCGYGGDAPGVFSVRASDGGGARRLTTNPWAHMDLPVDVSPDGSRILIIRLKPAPATDPDPFENQEFALYTVRTDGSHLRRVVSFGAVQGHEIGSAAWSPDGKSIIFSTPSGQIAVASANGQSFKVLNLDVDGFAYMPNWSPDGRRIVFGVLGPEQPDLFTARADGGDVRQLTNSPDFEHGPDWR